MIPRPPIIIRTATLFPCTALVLSFFVCPWVRALLRIYIEVLRTTPFLIQLFVLYYGGPSVGIELSAMTAGVVALAFYGSAYFADAFRSGFASIPRGHVEAAQCLGISRLSIFWRIQMPQLLVIITPKLVILIIILSQEQLGRASCRERVCKYV